MKRCGRCDRGRVVPVMLDDTIDACGHTFTAQLPAEKCRACGRIVIEGRDLRLFELRVAVELAKAGIRDKEAFKHLRKALSMDRAGLAHVLDIPEEFIGYWEGGQWPVDPRAHAVLCSLRGETLRPRLPPRPAAAEDPRPQHPAAPGRCLGQGGEDAPIRLHGPHHAGDGLKQPFRSRKAQLAVIVAPPRTSSPR